MTIELVAILTLSVAILKLGYELGKDIGKKEDRQSDRD